MFLSPGKEPLSKGKSMPEKHCLSSVTVGTGLANRERENKRIVEKKGVIALFEHSKTNTGLQAKQDQNGRLWGLSSHQAPVKD